MTTNYICFCRGIIDRASNRFVRDRMREQDHQIGAADPVFHPLSIFTKHLGFASVLFAEIDILPFHALVSANDHYTHINSILPLLFDCNRQLLQAHASSPAFLESTNCLLIAAKCRTRFFFIPIHLPGADTLA